MKSLQTTKYSKATKWRIYDWAGNEMNFKGISNSFESSEDAFDYLYDYLYDMLSHLSENEFESEVRS